MTWLAWLLLPLCVVASWFLWTALHELSHVVAARAFRKLTKVRFFLWPHMHEGDFYFARVQFWWEEGGPLKPSEEVTMKLAPRLLNIVAAIAFPFVALFSWPWNFAWAIGWGAGLIDFFVGSLGISPFSDLRMSAERLRIDPNVIRIIGLTIILVSVILGGVLLLVL